METEFTNALRIRTFIKIRNSCDNIKMKIINFVLGLGTAIILSALILLGIKAFHPGPAMPDYNRIVKPMAVLAPAPCDKTDTACITQQDVYNKEQQAKQDEYQKEQQAYQDALKVYNRDVFVIANVVGILVFVSTFLLLLSTGITTQAVPVGIMIAGLFSIIYGYMNGWDSTGDQLKFFVGLLIAVLVIGGSIWLMQRYQRKVEKSH